MRIAFVGDTHCNLENALMVVEKVAEKGVNTIVQVGDFGFWPRNPHGAKFLRRLSDLCVDLGVTFHWIDGNHEDHSSLNHDQEEPWEHHPNLIWHPRGTVFELGGRKILAYGGAQSVDKYYQMDHGSWFKEEYPSPFHWERAVSAGKVDILVTHEAPSGLQLTGMPKHLIPPELLRSSENMQESISLLIQEVDPRVVVHGHFHQRLITVRDNRLILSLAHDFVPIKFQVVIFDLDLIEAWGKYPASILETW